MYVDRDVLNVLFFFKIRVFSHCTNALMQICQQEKYLTLKGND
jgi:hypothetical protein